MPGRILTRGVDESGYRADVGSNAASVRLFWSLAPDKFANLG